MNKLFVPIIRKISVLNKYETRFQYRSIGYLVDIFVILIHLSRI